jgi:hypothetical protein
MNSPSVPDLTRLAPGAYRAAPASLLALAAWQDGNGVLANVALDLALAARSGYPMAVLLREALDYGAPPEKADPGPIARTLKNEARKARAANRPAGRPPG